ncbi:hypothetical protein PRIPAC_87461 [Pristionchus pacificus]|uniref:Uncharacterized protein n=1 Tax=Pristionchus pacificus TaxID=54126 RepID=A0A2A6B8U5_PRIPA|nr:hypothetical protein PRIPAC_87461 [Pristionchus pacificus]|eukprot:PDM62302.1 hypothetical protein PRIPAC_51744 [Pristionchus pacificus]
MCHATLFALVLCHGRPLLISTMSTVPSRYHFPTPPSSRLLADTPLNTVTTTSEDRPTTATPEESSTVAHSTTVTPRTVERLSDLHDSFDIKNCMDGDTICYFLPRCFSSDFDASTDLWLVTVTLPLLDKFALEYCDVVAIVKNGQLELRRPFPLLNEKFTLREYGLTIDNKQVQCTDCIIDHIAQLDKVHIDTFNLPRRMTTKISSKRSPSASSTIEPLHHETTTESPNHSTTPSTTTKSHTTTTTPQKRSTKRPPLPLPHTPSLVTDPAGILDRDEADDVTAATSELKESGWGLAVIILLVIIVIIVLALIISIYRNPTSVVVQTRVYEWPINMPIERSTDMTEDEDNDERTPLAPNSVRSCARTVDSASRTPLVQPAVPESSGPDFSAKLPTPARESCATIEVSVTPSKEKQIKSTKPESKRPLREKAKALFKHSPRTPLMEKTAQPPSNTLEELVVSSRRDTSDDVVLTMTTANSFVLSVKMEPVKTVSEG